MLEMTETDMGNLVALYDKKRASGTIDCLYAKDVLKNKLYVYGANDITQYIKGGNMGEKLAEHVKDLMECGCDGIKMLEGKPTSRKRMIQASSITHSLMLLTKKNSIIMSKTARI